MRIALSSIFVHPSHRLRYVVASPAVLRDLRQVGVRNLSGVGDHAPRDRVVVGLGEHDSPEQTQEVRLQVPRDVLVACQWVDGVGLSNKEEVHILASLNNVKEMTNH